MVFLILLFFLLLPQSVFATSDIQISAYSVKTPEWIQITNSSSNPITLTGWYFKDADGNTKTIDGCISSNSTKIYEYNGFLNDTGDSLSLYNSSNNLVYDAGVLSITQLEKPSSTSTCIIPTSTPTPTSAPTATPTPTNTPTPDLTVTNPTSGISLTEFMPYSDPEWLEFYNSNDFPVKLVSWKLEDKDSNTRNISSISIGAKSYTVFEYSPFLDNNNSETVILRNQDNTIISQMSYGANLRTVDRSWSSISGSWCQASITKGYENVTSCYAAPTSTPVPSATPTIDPNTDTSKFTSDKTATESAIIEPASESSFLTPSPTSLPTPTLSSVLGDSTSEDTSSKKNYLPLILVIVGGLLLASPAIINKIKPQK